MKIFWSWTQATTALSIKLPAHLNLLLIFNYLPDNIGDSNGNFNGFGNLGNANGNKNGNGNTFSDNNGNANGLFNKGNKNGNKNGNE